MVETHPHFERTERHLEEFRKITDEDAGAVLAALRGYYSRIDKMLMEAANANFPELEAVRSHAQTTLSEVTAAGKSFAALNQALRTVVDSQRTIWQTRLSSHKADYEQALKALAGHRGAAEELKKVEEASRVGDRQQRPGALDAAAFA